MSNFFTYKGYPLVRQENFIYYGNMSDDYVIMLEVKEKQKVKDLDVASKVKIYQMSTDLTLPPTVGITQTAERESLYEALDLANAWHKRKKKS